MKRAVLPVLALLALAGAPAAEAKSKAFCRDWARDVADSRDRSGSQQAAGVIPAVGEDDASPGATASPEVIGVADQPEADAGSNWQIIYRRAYAACRAS